MPQEKKARHLNVKLLREAKAKILAEPRQFIMAWFFGRTAGGIPLHVTDVPRVIPNCGTACCIAGWVNACADDKTPAQELESLRGVGIGQRASDLLGIKPWEATKLFNVEAWPDAYRRQWSKTRSLKERSRIAARRIEAFIKEFNCQ